MKKIIIIIISIYTGYVFAADYAFEIKYSEFEGNLDVFVSQIDEAGKNIITGGNLTDTEKISDNISIKKENTFGDIIYTIQMDRNIENECRVWIRNDFVVDNFDFGKEFSPVDIAIQKDGKEIGSINLIVEENSYSINTILDGIEKKMKLPSKDKSGLWNVCTIIPKSNKLLVNNDFYNRTKVITGKIWNTYKGTPFAGVEVLLNNKKASMTDNNGNFVIKYDDVTQDYKIQAVFGDIKSDIVNLKILDEFPRIVNFKMSYNPDPPPKINFRKTYRINFAYDSDLILDNNNNNTIIEDMIKTMKKFTIIGKVRIEGHTDSSGSENYNFDLSYKRANSILEKLTEAGFPKSSFSIFGFGESRPIASNGSENGKAENRRVEIAFEYQE